MRLTLAAVILLSSSPAWAGDLLVAEPAAQESASADARPAGPADPAPKAMAPGRPEPRPAGSPAYAGLYDAPVFGHVAPTVAKVDESALRFYASQKNRARVEAEIKRLRGLHPDWKVPANLYASGNGNDEQPLWDLFSAGRTEELRFAIQAREKREPGWRPSADLLAKMARQEVAGEFVALSNAREWGRVLVLAAQHPDVFTCGTVDLDWRVAQAFAAVNLPERSYEVDAAILNTCRDRDERLATVRKAVDLLPDPAVERLIAAGTTLADGTGEFDAVRLDLARRQIGRATPAADGPSGGEEASSANLDALGQATLRSGDATDAALLGWYHLGRGRAAEADGWFKLGLAGSSGDAKMAEGHALALRALGRLEEAEELAHVWRERSAAMRGLFVTLLTERLGKPDTAPVDRAEMADLTAILAADRDAAGAGALAWAAYGHQNWEDAALWFGRAVDWAGSGDIPNKVVEGYGISLQSLGRFEAAEAFLDGRRDRSAAARDLFVSVAISALSGGVPPAPEAVGPFLPVAPISPERMDRFAEAIRAAQSAPGATALGWHDLRDGRPAAAVDLFREGIAWSPGGKGDLKTIEGLVLALKDSGNLEEAETVSFARAADSAQLREAYRGIMVAELTTPALAEHLTDDRLARFAAMVEAETSAEGAQALGWYRLSQDRADGAGPGQDRVGAGGCGYAVEWFRKAARWSPDKRGTEKGQEGYAQALARAGHDLAAADVAVSWADRAPDMTALYIKIMVEALTRDLFPPRVAEGQLARLSAVVRDQRSGAGAQALAWYRYRDAGTGYGVAWFQDAIDWSPDHRADAKTIEGYASALRDVGRLADAEEALFPWVDRVPLMRDLYIDTVVSELTLDNPPEPMPHDRLARFIAIATPLRSAAAAQALGWYRFARHEDADSVIWFQYAVDWWPTLPPDADRYTYVPEGYRPLTARLALKPEDYRRTPRAFTSRAHDGDAAAHRYVDTFGGLATTWTGYALALRAVGRTQEAEEVAYTWRDRWPTLGRLFVDLAIETLTRPAGAAPIAPERMKRFAAVIEEERDAGGAAALGWAAAARDDWAEAAVWLKAATDWRPADAGSDPGVIAGYVDALRRAGRAEEAFVAASSWGERLPELKAKMLDIALDVLASAGDVAEAAAGGGTDGGAIPAAAGAAPGPASPAPERVAQAVALAKADTAARSAAALGWFHLKTRDPASALVEFRAAIGRAGDAAPPGPTADADASDGAAALPKAVEGFALALRAVGRDADAITFAEAWAARIPALAAMPGDIVASLLTRDGGRTAPGDELMERMGATAARTRSVPAAAALGWYGYHRRDWVKAANWFASGIAWSPDRRAPVKLVEGYAASLHNQCRFEESETAALSRLDDDVDGALRRIYVDSVADRVARQKPGMALPPAEAARFAAAILATDSSNGAQALGWYAYRSRQFAAAAAWFEKAVAWHATEADVFGLALSYRGAREAENLRRVLTLYEGRFPSLAAVRRAGTGGREPAIPNFAGDLARRDCAGTGPDERADGSRPPMAGLPAVSPAALAAVALETDAAPPAVPRPLGPERRPAAAPASERAPGDRRVAAPVVRSRPVVVATVEASPAPPSPPEPEPSRATASGANGGAELSAKDDARCLAALSRRPARSAADRAREGWCLLGLQRPEEATRAFRAARASRDGRVASDSALGETLSRLRAGDTDAAVAAAAHVSLGAAKRRQLGVQILSQQAADAYRAGDWSETLERLGQRSRFERETREVVMLRGWALYQRGDYEAARRSFREADDQLSDDDSRTALRTVITALTPKAFR